MATCPDCGKAMLTERPHRHEPTTAAEFHPRGCALMDYGWAIVYGCDLPHDLPIAEAVATALARVRERVKGLREYLSSLEHDQWMTWAASIMASESISPERAARWQATMIPYDNLPDEVKEYDRIWADKVRAAVLAILEGDVSPRTTLASGMPWPARCRWCDLITEDPDAYFYPRDWDPEMVPEDRRCPNAPDGVHEPQERP